MKVATCDGLGLKPVASPARGREVLRVGEFLPGRLVIERGRARDYSELERFHYVRERPATWAGVWRVVYEAQAVINGPDRPDPFLTAAQGGASLCPAVGRVVAVGVLSWPLVTVHVRDEILGLGRGKSRAKIGFLNAHVRTISRVIVHPQFRSLGLASRIVRRICEGCSTRYVEAVAVMGRVHPFFERGGMRRVGVCGEGDYFLFDRWANGNGEVLPSPRPSPCKGEGEKDEVLS